MATKYEINEKVLSIWNNKVLDFIVLSSRESIYNDVKTKDDIVIQYTIQHSRGDGGTDTIVKSESEIYRRADLE